MNITHRYEELVSLAQLFIAQQYPDKKQKIRMSASFTSFQKNRPAEALPFTRTHLSHVVGPVSKDYFQPQCSAPLPPEPVIPTPTPLPTKPEQPVPSPDPKPPVIQKSPVSTLKKTALAFELEPLIQPVEFDKRPFQELFQKYFSYIPLSETIPSYPSLSKKVKGNVVKAKESTNKVCILLFHEAEASSDFLKKVANAISDKFIPTFFISGWKISNEQEWQSIMHDSQVRLFLVNEHDFHSQSFLKQYLRTDPNLKKSFVVNTPLVFLKDLVSYPQESALKVDLWRAICNELAIFSPN